MKQTYIFICSYNRLIPLKKLIDCLLNRNYTNIVILDNQSTYQPLLDWYSTLNDSKVSVYYCKKNYGAGALDDCRQFEESFRIQYLNILETEYYVYTDSDVVPIDEISDNFIDDMIDMAKIYNIPKLGLSLKLDDLPDHFIFKQQVIQHESQFFLGEFITDSRCQLYKAPVDTTFAIHEPGISCGWNGNAYRTSGNYFARHYPWYYDTKNLPDDEKYYYNHLERISHWSILIKQSINS